MAKKKLLARRAEQASMPQEKEWEVVFLKSQILMT
jgi:hypothetical protein